ncbi:MAG TPA: hypothetical protein VMI10_14420 [Terriglobales bacterium]|nr:hypothetical protein [Terriglobales bacterium]
MTKSLSARKGKNQRRLKAGKKLEEQKPLEIVITKHTDASSPH